jgi:hypothetical protein
MNEPTGYTSHAIDDIKSIQSDISKWEPITASELSKLVLLMRSSVKFSLPADARLIDVCDVGRDYIDLVQLPYPVVTLEFSVAPIETSGIIKQSKRIVVCWDKRASTAWKFNGETPEADSIIYCLAISFDDIQRMWIPETAVAWIDKNFEFNKSKNRLRNVNFIFPFPEWEEKARSSEHFESDLSWAIETSVFPMISFCLAINCSNVAEESITPSKKLNSKRVQNGKEPFDTCHVLTVGGRSVMSGTNGGTHSSPRMHLRRGHIRRLSSGKTIWVNNTIVGRSELGSVSKSYNVLCTKHGPEHIVVDRKAHDAFEGHEV